MIFTNFLVDLWWFQLVSYWFYFWQRLLYQYLVFAGFTLLSFLIILSNFWVAARFVGKAGGEEAEPDSTRPSWFQRMIDKFRRGSLKFYIVFSLIVAVFLALPLYRH